MHDYQLYLEAKVQSLQSESEIQTCNYSQLAIDHANLNAQMNSYNAAAPPIKEPIPTATSKPLRDTTCLRVFSDAITIYDDSADLRIIDTFVARCDQLLKYLFASDYETVLEACQLICAKMCDATLEDLHLVRCCEKSFSISHT